jgi:tetratricopeptide (TPR) repeat protein
MRCCCLLLALAALGLCQAPAQLSAQAQLSSVDQRIASAQKRIQSDPKSWQGYNDLAAAYCRKGRDNSDAATYRQAQAALDRSFQLSPANYDAEKLQVTVWLGEHRVADALKLATQLNNKVHDDIGVWGLLVDSNVALGNLKEAERDAQWILDLRAGSSLGFEKAAGLRVLFGDPEGAIEFYEEAKRRTSSNDADQRAWLATQIAKIELDRGNVKAAEDRVREALKLFPDSQLALVVESKVRMVQAKR